MLRTNRRFVGYLPWKKTEKPTMDNDEEIKKIKSSLQDVICAVQILNRNVESLRQYVEKNTLQDVIYTVQILNQNVESLQQCVEKNVKPVSQDMVELTVALNKSVEDIRKAVTDAAKSN